MLKKNSRKRVKLMVFSKIKKKNKITIILVMPRLKMVVEDKVVVSEVLVVLIFQIFLRIFLEILEVEEDQGAEALITEAQI